MYYLLFAGVMLTPVAMIVIALIWRRHPPKDINHFFGYRTTLSMKNEDTWQFAHQHISKLWLRIGIILSIVSIVLMVALRANYMSFVLWIVTGQMVFLCISVFLVDSVMKAIFDENGNRREDIQ